MGVVVSILGGNPTNWVFGLSAVDNWVGYLGSIHYLGWVFLIGYHYLHNYLDFTQLIGYNIWQP